MKYSILYILILVPILTFGQDKRTIYYNDNENVVLIFPDPITRAIPGNNEVGFGFDKSTAANYGLLRGKSKNKTNLIIFTSSGQFYNFNVEYKKELKDSDKTYFVKTEDSAGTTLTEKEILEKSKVTKEAEESASIEPKVSKAYPKETSRYKDKIKDESGILYNTDRDEHYKKFSSNIFSKKSYYKRYFARYGKVKMKLLRIVYNRNELYFVLEIENESGVDYEMNLINFSKVASKPNKDAGFQSINIEPVFIYNDFETIKAHDKKRAVYVFKKFGVNKDKILNIETNELKGERNLSLKIFPREINNPL